MIRRISARLRAALRQALVRIVESLPREESVGTDFRRPAISHSLWTALSDASGVSTTDTRRDAASGATSVWLGWGAAALLLATLAPLAYQHVRERPVHAQPDALPDFPDR